MSILTSWSPFFQSNARMRGRALLNSDSVERIAPDTGELVRAKVHVAETDEDHLVTIARQGTRALAECDCATFDGGAYCEHIWATLLDIQQEEGGPGASAEELAGLRVRAPKARKRDGDSGSRASRSSEPAWIGRLSLLRPPTYDMEQEAAQSLPMQRQICYVILPEASMRHQGLVVEIRQRTAIATGWSKTRSMKISTDLLPAITDPVDRQLCALILGADHFEGEVFTGYSAARSHAAYRLPRGAWRTLLQQMVQTQRCFVDLDEQLGDGREVTLQWDGDDSWRLWMVGKQDEQGDELQINVELRRGDERLTIHEPMVLLGGSDGVMIWDGRVAPFDDCDSYRWATQFRDEYRKHEETRPICVPTQDIERFLDRLYMLPQIPEMDLPAGVGRVPQQVEPVLHLDLFSPDSPETSSVLPASAKSQLLGRVWFEYAKQRVTPGQAGRFVTISSAASLTDTEAVAVGEAMQHAQGEAEAVGTFASDGDGQTSDFTADSDAGEIVETQEAVLIRRDHRTEAGAMATLAELGLRSVSGAGPDTLTVTARQMPTVVSMLLAHGWVVSADQQAIRRAGTPSLSITSGIDWFELRGTISYEDEQGRRQEVPLPEVLQAVRSGRQLVTLSDGSHGLLPEQWLDEHGLLTTLGKLQKDHLRFRSSQAAMLDALLSDQELTSIDDTFAKARQRLRQFDGITPLTPGPDFQGTLRPYQREGLGWMAFLRWFGMGGILADDMGLGKTVQVLAVLQARKQGIADHIDQHEKDQPHRPTLVVAPRSVLFNWMDEAQRFTPDLRVMAYAGTDREELRAAFRDHDIIVTSYGLIRRDIAELRDHAFDYIILDEAQAIKNPASQAAKSVRLLEARHRLALTGTPVENHLGDLWSIFEFLNPGMLGSSARFGELVRATAAAPSMANGSGNGDRVQMEAVQQIAKALRPFILRRTKKQVLDDLPEKTEQTIVCEMEPAQRQMYDELRQYYRSHLFQRLDELGTQSAGGAIGGKAGFMVLEALLRLRQAACHPGLIDEKRADDASAKLDVLQELLGDVIEENSKALIFSQFTSMLSLVRKQLDARGIRYAYLDGQTRDRREVVQQFQNDPDIPVFLISLKSGGFGLNLTAAEYVFILDPWWNPAVEQQAIDRTHRIGQTQHVFAYRLICQDTVEQRIIQLQNRKREIADAIVGGEQNVLQKLSREDLEQLLS